MATGLNALKVFSQYAKGSMTEVLTQQAEKFNAASNGAIVLRVKSNDGDYSDASFWKLMDNLVRRRNAYGTGSVSAIDLEQLQETSVKVAAGTPPVKIPPSRMRWILKSPQEQGVVYGQQLAVAQMLDMLNTAIGSIRAALSNVTTGGLTGSGVVTDGTAGELSYLAMNTACRPFGDRASRISCWVSHSLPYFDLMGANLTNSADLFSWDTLRVMSDHLGRPLVITDSDALIDPTGIDDDPATPSYFALGLVPGAVMIEDNGDFEQNIETSNGSENIERTIQSEWSYNVAVKGFAWDKTNGGKSPTTAALTTASNWDRVATDIKDLPGVILETQ